MSDVAQNDAVLAYPFHVDSHNTRANNNNSNNNLHQLPLLTVTLKVHFLSLSIFFLPFLKLKNIRFLVLFSVNLRWKPIRCHFFY